MKKYQIIYADPPWSYKRLHGHSQSNELEYNTATDDFILNLNVKSISDKNCILFLWATSPFLEQALKTMNAWGFHYKTVAFVWSKKTKNDKLAYTMGFWTMGNVEYVLLGTKGQIKRQTKTIKQLIIEKRTKHSAKPLLIKEKIVELMGKDLKKIELFAREKTEGWDVFGDEVKSDITL